ncbi:hypothetical protein ACJQWK_10726 [Exserohilum turcicum]
MPHGQPPTTSDVGCRARATSVFDIFAARPACEKKPYLEPDDLFRGLPSRSDRPEDSTHEGRMVSSTGTAPWESMNQVLQGPLQAALGWARRHTHTHTNTTHRER